MILQSYQILTIVTLIIKFERFQYQTAIDVPRERHKSILHTAISVHFALSLEARIMQLFHLYLHLYSESGLFQNENVLQI